MTGLSASDTVQIVVDLACAVLYAWVGFVVNQREVSAESRRANSLFATWWWSLALVFLLVPAYLVPLHGLGYQDVPYAVGVLLVLLVLVVVAIWGLAYYLVYIYTGNARWFAPLTVFYAALAALLVGLVAYLGPNGFDAQGNLTYAREQLGGPGAVALGLLYSAPVLLAALAYASLFFRRREPLVRYRVALVSGGFLLQFGWSVASTFLQLSRRYPNSLALSLVGDALAVLSALAVLLAFRPPRGLRERLERDRARAA